MEDSRKANRLCILSLVCVLFPGAIGFLGEWNVISTVNEAVPGSMEILSNLMSWVSGIAFIAGIVLIIFVRVKYPQNIFGKVLMWVYIVAAIVIFAFIVLLILTCASACGAFETELVPFCENCRSLE